LAKILPKRSSVGGNVPGTDDLAEFEIAINYADRKIYGRSGSNIVVLAEPSNGGGGGGGDTETDSYTENTFTNGVLSEQKKYTSQGGTLLETKTFTYTNGSLTQVLVKDGSDVTTLTQTIAYDGDGNVSSITKDYA
jgi:hypothetical protein